MLINLKNPPEISNYLNMRMRTLFKTQTKAATVHVSKEKIFLAFNEQGHN